MQIIKPGAGHSTAFIIQPGKQLTLSAQGLAEDDIVQIEVVTLSRAPEFSGNPCCDMAATDIEVVSATPLMCATGVSRQLTAESPYVVLDGPQLITLRATVIASPAALVSVDLLETDSDGSAEQWRCQSAASPIDIGSLPPVVIEALPDVVISELPILEIQKHVVATHETCGELWYIWSDGTKTTETLPACPVPEVYCPSLPVSCDGDSGFGFHEMDPKDPAATVVMTPCDGDATADPLYIYPSAGPGHTVKITDELGALVGYAVNKSDCAPACCPKDPVINVRNNFAPTTNVAAPNVDITLPAPNLVAHALSNDGVLTSTLSNGDTVVSNPLPSC